MCQERDGRADGEFQPDSGGDGFVQFDAEVWDRQFDSDAQNGKLDELAARALRDHNAGRSTEL
jgi:hypothetical protein